MNRWFVILLVIAAGSVARGDDKSPKTDGKSLKTEADLKLIYGKWEIVKYEKDGQRGAEQIGAVVEFTNSLKMTVTLKDDEKEEAQFLLNADTELKQLDIIFNRGDRKRTAPGIYRFDGDKLEICFNEKSLTRPEDFDPGEGDNYQSLVLKRVKSEKKDE